MQDFTPTAAAWIPVPAPGIRRLHPRVLGFDECLDAMTQSDRNSDDLLNQQEYSFFVEFLSPDDYGGLAFPQLPQDLRRNYFQLRTSTSNQIDIFGSKPSQRPADDDQQIYLAGVCDRTTAILDDIQACFNAMASSDRNSDDYLNQQDYTYFVGYLSEAVITGRPFPQLPDGLRQNYFQLLSENDQIGIFGSKEGQNSSPEELAQLDLICRQTRQVIDDVLNSPAPVATPGPTPGPTPARLVPMPLPVTPTPSRTNPPESRPPSARPTSAPSASPSGSSSLAEGGTEAPSAIPPLVSSKGRPSSTTNVDAQVALILVSALLTFIKQTVSVGVYHYGHVVIAALELVLTALAFAVFMSGDYFRDGGDDVGQYDKSELVYIFAYSSSCLLELVGVFLSFHTVHSFKKRERRLSKGPQGEEIRDVFREKTKEVKWAYILCYAMVVFVLGVMTLVSFGKAGWEVDYFAPSGFSTTIGRLLLACLILSTIPPVLLLILAVAFPEYNDCLFEASLASFLAIGSLTLCPTGSILVYVLHKVEGREAGAVTFLMMIFSFQAGEMLAELARFSLWTQFDTSSSGAESGSITNNQKIYHESVPCDEYGPEIGVMDET